MPQNHGLLERIPGQQALEVHPSEALTIFDAILMRLPGDYLRALPKGVVPTL